MPLPVDGLRLLQAVAVRGSLSAAATDLGYTQSAATRQLAALERSAARRLVNRGPRGATLTATGAALLPYAARVLDALDAAERAARGRPAAPLLRLGAFPSAGPALLPRALTTMAQRRPDLHVHTREGTSPALVRAVQAGKLDAALVISRPPFHPFTTGTDRLREERIGTMELRIAIATRHPLAHPEGIHMDDLLSATWIGPVNSHGDPTLGVWPSIRSSPDLPYRTDDWLTRMQFVSAGLAITTAPPIVAAALPPDVLLLPVIDAPTEERRITLLHAGDDPDRAPELLDALREALEMDSASSERRQRGRDEDS